MEVETEANRINDRFKRGKWRPIVFLNRQHTHQEVRRYYRAAHLCMVTSLHDGMNLVAKEAVSVSRRNAVLALSENTGAHEELGAFAVTLHPFDIQQQADALYEALMMPAAKRRDLRQAAADIVRANDVAKWLAFQLADLAEITGLWS